LTPDVVIIGAGLAGLSAAVELSRRGNRVLLLEQRPYAGGRVRSFTDSVTGDTVDNGQHLLMGCYAATRSYLTLIGSDHLAALQPSLRIDFLHPGGRVSSLKCPPLPAPLHAGLGMLNLASLPLADRLRLLRVGLQLLTTSPQKERELDSLSVDEWLTRLSQTGDAKKYLWNVIAVGALNEKPVNVSALLFFRVLRSAFFGNRQNSSMLIPRAGLSEVLVNPAVRYIEAHGGTVLCSEEMVSAEISGGRIESLRASGGEIHTAPVIISAVPFFAFSRIFPPGSLQTRRDFSAGGIQDHFRPSTILGINLWFDRAVMDQEFAALLDSRIHWVFNRSRMLSGTLAASERRQLSLTVSAAEEYEEWDKEALVRMSMKELERYLPRVKEAVLVHSLVLKEKRATFVPSPGLEDFRPRATSALSNLFIAGDWTDTGYPATIEGAVLSGQRAAESLLRNRP